MALQELFAALWLIGIPLGLGLAGYGLLSRSAKAMLAASGVLCAASIPGFLGGAGLVVVLGAALALLGARRMRTFVTQQGKARALMLGLDAFLLLWVGMGLVQGGARPSWVDLLLWALLAAMTAVAFWPLPPHRQAAAQPA